MVDVITRRVVRADPGALELYRASLNLTHRERVEQLTNAETEEEIARLRGHLAIWDAEIASVDALIAERASA